MRSVVVLVAAVSGVLALAGCNGDGSASRPPAVESSTPRTVAPTSSSPAVPVTEGSASSAPATIGPDAVSIRRASIEGGSLMIDVVAPASVGFRWRGQRSGVVECGFVQRASGQRARYAVQCAGARPPGVLMPTLAPGDGFEYQIEVPVRSTGRSRG